MQLRKCKTVEELLMVLESEFQQNLTEENLKAGSKRLLDIQGTSEIKEKEVMNG